MWRIVVRASVAFVISPPMICRGSPTDDARQLGCATSPIAANKVG
jgi:hypothetical protein